MLLVLLVRVLRLSVSSKLLLLWCHLLLHMVKQQRLV
jgi:hypothetical protein